MKNDLSDLDKLINYIIDSEYDDFIEWITEYAEEEQYLDDKDQKIFEDNYLEENDEFWEVVDKICGNIECTHPYALAYRIKKREES